MFSGLKNNERMKFTKFIVNSFYICFLFLFIFCLVLFATSSTNIQTVNKSCVYVSIYMFVCGCV